MAVREDGKEAITHYRLRERFRAHTALECRLETGRTHQIRVHMAHVRHPIIGDPLYGGALKLPKGASDELVAALRGFKRQALHAETLEFTHPITGEPVRNTAPPSPHASGTAGDGGRAAVAAGRLASASRRPCADHAPAWRGHLAGAVRAVQPGQPARGRWRYPGQCRAQPPAAAAGIGAAVRAALAAPGAQQYRAALQRTTGAGRQ
ncbi:hypothetical protein G6F46_013690 [Rhizopus delemar]|nr:hypothetical protein G6F46_013690 [Rhizopus delemar]